MRGVVEVVDEVAVGLVVVVVEFRLGGLGEARGGGSEARGVARGTAGK